MPAIRTTEDVERLKQQWVKDPHWDIEDTEGFEAYRDELIHYRERMEAQWKKEREEREALLNIKTFLTEIFANYSASAERDNLEISKLLRDGWTVVDVSYVTYEDNSGDFAVRVIQRLVTLTR